ncbi:hypothetical protein [Streptomyces sp. NPDC059783]|uniref:hypothetical protein n=1 Tax=Streptomyces sp. NPDC059783 TaxID=3346944 RepID=UPI0036665B68
MSLRQRLYGAGTAAVLAVCSGTTAFRMLSVGGSGTGPSGAGGRGVKGVPRPAAISTNLTAAVVAAADAGQDSPKVAQPPLCGLHRVDSAVQEAYGTLAGTRVRRRPLPKQMQPTARSVWKDWTDPPAHDLVVRRLLDLAWTVASYVDGGALRRELHPPAARAVSPAES